MRPWPPGREPASGDRILVIGYDTDHSAHAYDELTREYKSVAGSIRHDLDGHDLRGKLEVFFHAPFADDCAAPATTPRWRCRSP